MMKPGRWIWMLLAAVLAGAFAVVRLSRHADRRPRPSSPDRPQPRPLSVPRELSGFIPYAGTAPGLPCAFEIPEAWVAGEQTGRRIRYRQVLVLGPRNHADTFSAGLTVRFWPVEGPAESRSAALQERISQRRRQLQAPAHAALLSEAARRVGDYEATELLGEFTTPMVRRSAEGTLDTTVRTHTVLFSAEGGVYELAYAADAADFARYAGAYEHLLGSFRLQR